MSEIRLQATSLLRKMFERKPAAVPLRGVTVIAFFGSTDRKAMFDSLLQDISRKRGMTRWDGTEISRPFFDERVHGYIRYFVTPSRGQKPGRVGRVGGAVPKQLPRARRIQLLDDFVASVERLFNSEDPDITGSNDGCVLAVLEPETPEGTASVADRLLGQLRQQLKVVDPLFGETPPQLFSNLIWSTMYFTPRSAQE